MMTVGSSNHTHSLSQYLYCGVLYCAERHMLMSDVGCENVKTELDNNRVI